MLRDAALTALADRWRDARPADRANFQLYITELCQALGVEKPPYAGIRRTARRVRRLSPGRFFMRCRSSAPDRQPARPSRGTWSAWLLLPLLILLCSPTPGSTQGSPEGSPLVFRHHAELQVLGAVAGGETPWPPSLRLALQRRQGLRTAVSLSAALLSDRLSRTAGLAAGGLVTLPVGRGVIEPFVEMGAGWTDARVDWGSYDVVDPDGQVRTVERFRAVKGPVALAGGGVSAAAVVGSRLSTRLSLGYWHVVGGEGVRRGGIRLGVGIGRARADRRWYALETDRDPPTVGLLGRHPATDDSVEVAGGLLHVLAADANGIAAIVVNGEEVPLRPAGASAARRLGLPPTAALGVVELRPPFGGMIVDVLVRDSAGLSARKAVSAFGPPDRVGPVVRLLPSESGAPLEVEVWAVVEDSSGIADSRIGPCPLSPMPASPSTDPSGPSVRLFRGWRRTEDGQALTARDRAGNETTVPLGPVAPRPAERGAAPELLQLAATAGHRDRSGRRSVRVAGAVTDPAGSWVEQVTVDGRAAVLRVLQAPSQVEFGGWVIAGPGTDSVVVEAMTADGRRVRTALAIPEEAARGPGALHLVVVAPDLPADHVPAIEALEDLAGARAAVLKGSKAQPSEIVAALVDLQRSAGPSDAALVLIGGALVGDPAAAEGAAVMFTGRTLDLTYIGRLLRAIGTGATLVRADLLPGHTWAAVPALAPGAWPPGGCYEDSEGPTGAVADLGRASPHRILSGLMGAADHDADGAITAGELLEYLDAAPPGLLPFDPLTTVRTIGGAQ